MKEHILHDEHGPNLTFTGEEVACVHESWRTLKLFRTRSGKYVCYYEYEVTPIYSYKSPLITECTDDIPEYFGYSKKAKELYNQAGLEYRREID